MAPFSSTSKVVGSLISRRSGIRHLVRNGGQSRKLHQIRCFSGMETPLIGRSQSQFMEEAFNSKSILSNANNFQRRSFLGCGDGEEGGVLSKIYEEKRVLG